jgi:hypothetical protein
LATSLQQLFDALTVQVVAPGPFLTIEDVTGAMAHLGRAASGLAEDGLTPTDSPRQHAVVQLGAACGTVGRLWPRTGGPLTDLAGAAADLIGRDHAVMGRAHRWAVTVELAEVTDHCAWRGQKLLPQAATAEFGAVRRLTAAIERDAQTDPPTAVGSAVLDRLVPVPAEPRRNSGTTLDAAAALMAALDRAVASERLTLREFRAAVAAAEITSRCAAAVTPATTGAEVGPLTVAATAWQLVGRMSLVLHDGRREGPSDPRGVVPWAQTLARALRADVGSVADIAALRERDDLPYLASGIRDVTNQLPVLAGVLDTAVTAWSRTGQLYAFARQLPPMENMPVDRVQAVIGGRGVRAVQADLEVVGKAIRRAGALSSALADSLNRAVATVGPPTERHLADLYRQQFPAPASAEHRLRHSDAVTQAAAHQQPPRSSGFLVRGTGPAIPQ